MSAIVKNMGLFRSVMLEPQSGFSLVETKVDKGSQDCPNMLGYSELYTDPRSLILAKKRKKNETDVFALLLAQTMQFQL